MDQQQKLFDDAVKAVLSFSEMLIALDEKCGTVGLRGRDLWLLASYTEAPTPYLLACIAMRVDDHMLFLKNFTNEDGVRATDVGEEARHALRKLIDAFRSERSQAS